MYQTDHSKQIRNAGKIKVEISEAATMRAIQAEQGADTSQVYFRILNVLNPPLEITGTLQGCEDANFLSYIDSMALLVSKVAARNQCRNKKKVAFHPCLEGIFMYRYLWGCLHLLSSKLSKRY